MNDNVFIKTSEFRSLNLQVIKRSLVILCMALFANSMSIHAQTINLQLVQDAFRDDLFDPGVAVPTPTMVTDYVSEDFSTVTNYVGTSIPHMNESLAQAALKFRLPQSSSVLSKAKLFFKVVDIQGNPTATVTLTDDNNWMQTTDEATSKFPTLSNASALLTNAPVSSTSWVSLNLATSDLDTKIVSSGTTDVTMIITGSTVPHTYFNFVADDDASGNKAYLRLTFKPQVQSVSVPANNTYKIGDVLHFTVSFDSLINVTGTPKLPITLNTGGTVQASYVSGTGTQNLVFRYTVASGDLDMDGVTVGNVIALNGGTIISDFGNDAELNLYNIGATTGVLINGILPAISSVSPTSGPIAGGTSVTITGTGFTGATAVKFASTNATSFAVNSATQITAVSPAGSAGGTDITITTPNGTSTTNINDKFTYVAAPTATTNAATSITSAGATLNGSINANGSTTTITFEYGLTTGYGTSVTADQSPVAGSSATSVSKAITGLTPGTTYHYRLKGVNASGTTYGEDLTFTTTNPMILTFNTTLGPDNSITLPLRGTVNVTVDWGDGSSNNYTNSSPAYRVHTYSTPGTYTVRITGSLSYFGFGGSAGTTNINLVSVTSFGELGLTSLSGALRAAPNLTTVPATLPSTVTDLSYLFMSSKNFNLDISSWNTQNVTNMSYMFFLAEAFNQNIGGWDVGKVTNMQSMFANATKFNQDIGKWNTASVTNMKEMFYSSYIFNQNIGNWDVSKVTDMSYMFYDAYKFDQNIGAWNVGNVTTMAGMLSWINLSNLNYNALLIGWASKTLKANVIFHADLCKYNSGAAAAARLVLTSAPNNWTITDGGLAPDPPTATTNAATSLTSAGATLNGSINANNASTAVTFQYGLTTSYGTTVTAVQSPVTGGTATPVSKAITGLAAGTTYHYRVVGVNSEGTTNGGDMSFTTLVPKPAATTNAATSISSTGATLNGSINAKNGSTTVTFEYGLTTSYGTTVTADQSPVTGSTATPVSKAITGLAAGVTYHYRVVGVNAGGTTNGGDKSFTTPLFAGNGTPEDPYPIATLADLKWVSEHSDIWNGSFVQTADIDASTTATWNAGKGFSPIGDVTTKFTGSYNGQYHTITGLTINRPGGNDYNIGLFGVTSSATLKNIGLPDCSIIGGYNVGALVGYMGYNSIRTSSISDCYCTGEVSGISYVGGLVGVNQTSGITNSYSTCKVTALTDAAGFLALNMNSTISNCFYDKNTSGQSDNIGKGTPKTTVEMKEQNTFTGWDFAGETANGTADIWAISSTQNNGYPCFKSQITSPTAPTVTTQAVTDIATTTATGNGDITGLGVPNPGSHGICWGTSANPTIIDNTVVNKGVVSATGAFSAPMTGLTPNTLYHVRAYATNSTGTVYGNDVSFTTKMPTVTSATTNAATSVTSTGATLNGSVNANNASTTVTFEYGLDTSYGTSVTADQSPVTGSTTTLVSKAITGLTAGTTYHYRVKGVNAGGTTNGDDQSFTTSKQSQTITFDPLTSKIYGDADFTPSVTASSGLTVSITTSDSNVATILGGHIHIVGTGTCTIYADQTGSDGYLTATQASQTLTVNKATLTVAADAQTKVYGNDNPTLTFQYSGWVNGVETIDTPPSISTTVDGTTNVGTYNNSITLSGGADNNYVFSYVPANFTVTQATLTATANAKTKVYGDANPTLTFVYSGWKNTDGESVLDTKPTASTTVDLLTNVGTHTNTITVSGGADNNYDFSYVAANFTVTQATLTATADAKTKVYGDANPTLTFVYSGWKNTDGESVLETKPTASTTVDLLTNVGTHTNTITVSGGADNNYAFSYVPANFTVTQATLTATANAKTKVYGDANPTLTFVYSGWKNSDTETVLDTKPVASTTVSVTTSPGTYANAITVSGGLDNNYDFNYVSASFTIGKGTIIAWLDSKTKEYGQENPVLTYHYTGFMNGDNESVLDNVPYPTTYVNRNTAVGIYTRSITMTGGLDDKYTIMNVPANFTVTKANQSITFNELAPKTYGDESFILSATSNSGLTISYTCSNSDVAIVTGNKVSIIGAGTALITASQEGNNNYISAGTVSQTLVVNQKPLAVVGTTVALKVYDGNNNAVLSGSTLTGTINQDLIMLANTATGTFSQTGVGTNIPVSTAMTISGDKVSNYVLSSPVLKADITAKPVTVTAQNASRPCDQAEQALSYTFEPALIVGDTFTGTLARTAGNTPGVYPISQGTLSLGTNYSINFTGSSYTITNTKNLAPMVDLVNDLKVSKNSKEVTVTLSGIDPVSNCFTQEIESITATAENKTLIPEILVEYIKGQPTAKLKVKIADNQVGETRIYVKLKDNGGTENNGTDTKEISFNIKVEIPTGIEDLNQGADAIIYPNPSSGLINIETSGFVNPFIRIFKVTGEEILKKTNLTELIQSINLVGNSPGLYFVEISDKEKNVTRKLIIKK